MVPIRYHEVKELKPLLKTLGIVKKEDHLLSQEMMLNPSSSTRLISILLLRGFRAASVYTSHCIAHIPFSQMYEESYSLLLH